MHDWQEGKWEFKYPPTKTPQELVPDLNATEAFNTILARSKRAKELALHPERMRPGWYEKDMPDAEWIKERIKNQLDREIHDLLGLGKLKAWGRVSSGHPPKEIRSEEWQEIELQFDERSLRSTPGSICANKRGMDVRSGGRIAYVQVQFSRTQFYAHFPLSDSDDQAKQAVPSADGVRTQVSLELAGLVNALLERAGAYDFKLPLPADDPFVKRHDELRNSTHPIWTDAAINQLRRDFLQYCGIVGQPLGDQSEHLSDRTELSRIGRRLIAALKGESAPMEEIPLFEAATRAYEQTKDNDIGVMAYGLNDSSDDLLTWYCNYMARSLGSGRPPLIKLFGNRPPSRIKEEIYADALTGYNFVVESGQIIFEERNRGMKYVNLTVTDSELNAAIQLMAAVRA